QFAPAAGHFAPVFVDSSQRCRPAARGSAQSTPMGPGRDPDTVKQIHQRSHAMITMLLQIVQHTPVWVWGLLAGLVALGVSQARDREVSLARITILPLVMLALSFSGVVSA